MENVSFRACLQSDFLDVPRRYSQIVRSVTTGVRGISANIFASSLFNRRKIAGGEKVSE